LTIHNYKPDDWILFKTDDPLPNKNKAPKQRTHYCGEMRLRLVPSAFVWRGEHFCSIKLYGIEFRLHRKTCPFCGHNFPWWR